MRQVWRMVAVVLGLIAHVPAALAQLTVDEVGGSVQVKAEGEGLAVFQPEPALVWIVVPGVSKVEIAGAVAGRAGWTVERLRVAGGVGVALRTPQPRMWQVAGRTGAWQIKVGSGVEEEDGAVRRLSGVVLKDGLVGALAVSDAAGRRYRVLPQAEGGVGTGLVEEIAANAGVRLVATVQGMAEPVEGTVRQVKAVPVELPTIPLASVPEGRLAFKPGPSLRPIATPVGKDAARVEEVEPAAGPEVSASVAKAAAPVSLTLPLAEYKPGQVVPFTLPPHYRLEEGRLRRINGSADVQRKLEFARAYGAVRDATERAERTAAMTLSPPAGAPHEEIQIAEQGASEPVLHEEGGHSLEAQLVENGGHGQAEVQASETVVAAAEEVSGTVAEVVDEGDANGLFPVTGSARKYVYSLQSLRAFLARAEVNAGAVIVGRADVSGSVAALAEGGHGAPAGVSETTAMQAWVRSPADVAETPEVVRVRRSLVAFYLAWQRPEEAAAEIALLPQRDGTPAAAADRFYLALSYVMRGRGAAAHALLEKDTTFRPVDRNLWKAVALQQMGQSAAALQMWPRNDMWLKNYPSRWRQLAWRNRAEALVAAGSQGDAVAFADEIAAQYPAKAVPGVWRRLQGVSRMRTREEQKGLEFLAEAAADARDEQTAYLAKYEFVQALLRRNELDDRQVTDYLEDLRLLWRGDALEAKVLNQLGDYYLRQRDYRSALNRWRTLVRVYPNTPGMTAITDNMTRAVLGAFDPENPDQYDALTYIGLYFDFRELLPDDERGDRVMEMAGRYLTQTELAERAIPVLEQLLYYRSSEPIDQARVALLLADAYRGAGKADLALKTLDKYKDKAVNTVQVQQWPFAEAEALLALDRPAEAVKALKGANGIELPRLTAEALWQLQDWTQLKGVLEPQVARIRPVTLPKSVTNQVNVMRLAYAYGQLGDRAALEGLLNVYGEVGATLPTMADSLAAIATQAGVAKGVDAGRPLADVAGSLAALNAFTDKFRQEQRDAAERQVEQEEYNNKMRYMDLLPPPSI